jgi:pimeloyl-ACP methyl ester carboxylesterase
VVGVSLGGWIAAEIAIKSTARISHLVLANAVGIKVGGREQRDIADIFAITQDEFLALAYCDPAAGTRDYKAMPEAEVKAVARNISDRATRGRRSCMTPSSRGACTASASRRSFSGERTIVC